MTTPTNNPMDDDHDRDTSGCGCLATIAFATIITAIILLFT